MVIGINCPSITFHHEKKDELKSQEEKSWSLEINQSDPSQQALKLKYVIRFFYDANLTSDDYRNSKEGVFDLSLATSPKEDRPPVEDDPFSIFTQKAEER